MARERRVAEVLRHVDVDPLRFAFEQRIEVAPNVGGDGRHAEAGMPVSHRVCAYPVTHGR